MSTPPSLLAVSTQRFLPTGDVDPGEAFRRWQQFSQNVPELPIARILQGATVSTLSEEVLAAYEAPFPDESYKAGARQFPMLVPTQPDDPASEPNRLAWESLERFDKPFLCAFGDSDPVTAGGDRCCASVSRAPPDSHTSRSPTPVTSCRGTSDRSWQRRSSTSSRAVKRTNCLL